MAVITTGNGHPPPHARVREGEGEYLIALDVSDVDPRQVNAVFRHGTLEIHAARTSPRKHEFHLINPNAEAC